MAISIVNGNQGTATEKTSDQTLALTPAGNFTADNYALLAVVIDNTGTAEGETDDITVTDTKGNSYYRLREQTEANTAALTGVTCALFIACVSNGLLTTDTVNIALAANATAKGAGLAELSVAAGKILVLSVAGANGSNAAADTTYSVALSSLTNVAGLYIGMAAAEDELDAAVTLDATYAEIGFGSIGSGVAGQPATNVRARVGTLANTSTGDTFDITGLDSADRATILVRLQEDDLELYRQKTRIACSAVQRALPLPSTLSRLQAPVVVSEQVVFVAEPIKTFFRTAAQFRPIPVQSVLRLAVPEEPVPPPPPPSDENPAPVIYGYGAM